MMPAIAWIDSKSPCEAAAKPASITSTFKRSSCRAMRSFSSLVIDAPGDCSPSRRVVSKIISRLDELADIAYSTANVYNKSAQANESNTRPNQHEIGRAHV